MRVFAPLAYAYPIDRLVGRTKFGRSMAHGRLLGHLLVAGLGRRAGAALPDSAVLVPIPLHWRRLGQRGFNQAGEIARVVAAATGLGLRPDWLTRTTATPPQSGLSGVARRRNLAGAFQGRPANGATVILVDDVVTTAATALAAAAALLASGAGTVELWAVARTLAPGAAAPQPADAAKL